MSPDAQTALPVLRSPLDRSLGGVPVFDGRGRVPPERPLYRRFFVRLVAAPRCMVVAARSNASSAIFPVIGRIRPGRQAEHYPCPSVELPEFAARR
jgi:hypothetical protein